MGARRASTRRSNGYWTRQAARTERNRIRRRVRHMTAHPRDKQARDQYGELLEA